VKLVEFSGTKRGTYLEGKIIELKSGTNTDIREMCRGVNEFEKGYQARTDGN
jgi:hypothetical protein